jgi:hypothetical protein
MRLDRYLIEVLPVKNIYEYLDIIGENCSKIIKVYQTADNFIYRGVEEKGDFLERKGRTKVRIPRDTPPEIHRYLNKLFKEKFGWKVRDGISTTPVKLQTYLYGRPYIFFPADGYKFAWSKRYGDLWLHIRKNTPIGGVNDKRKQSALKRAVNTYIDTDLVGAISKTKKRKDEGEIMFKVEKYYLITESAERDIREALEMSIK